MGQLGQDLNGIPDSRIKVRVHKCCKHNSVAAVGHLGQLEAVVYRDNVSFLGLLGNDTAYTCQVHQRHSSKWTHGSPSWQHQAKTGADLRIGFPLAILMSPQLFL